jgi:hypothetical protein
MGSSIPPPRPESSYGLGRPGRGDSIYLTADSEITGQVAPFLLPTKVVDARLPQPGLLNSSPDACPPDVAGSAWGNVWVHDQDDAAAHIGHGIGHGLKVPAAEPVCHARATIWLIDAAQTVRCIQIIVVINRVPYFLWHETWVSESSNVSSESVSDAEGGRRELRSVYVPRSSIISCCAWPANFPQMPSHCRTVLMCRRDIRRCPVHGSDCQ